MADLYIQSVKITPNPVTTKAQFKIEVEIYTLYPALDLYPGEDLFGLFPQEEIFPGTNVYPIEGGMSE